MAVGRVAAVVVVVVVVVAAEEDVRPGGRVPVGSEGRRGQRAARLVRSSSLILRVVLSALGHGLSCHTCLIIT